MVFWIESPVTKQETDLSAKWWFEISMCQFPWPSKLVDDKGWWSRLNISNGHHMPWRLKYDVITIYSRVQKKDIKAQYILENLKTCHFWREISKKLSFEVLRHKSFFWSYLARKFKWWKIGDISGQKCYFFKWLFFAIFIFKGNVIQGVPTSFRCEVLMKISNLREIGILNFFVKIFVKLKWDLHCLAWM